MNATVTSPRRLPFDGGAWTQFVAFVRRPVLPDRAAGPSAEGLLTVVKLLVLDVLVMTAFIAGLALAGRLGIKPPDSLLEHLKIGPALLAFIALGAPLGEELIFRSWQSGRAGHVGALLLTLTTLGIAYWTVTDGRSPARSIATLAVLVAGLALAIWWLWSRRGRPAAPWFQGRFPWFYFGATFLFAAAHVTNFAAVSLALLPLTLPQFSVGLMLGYVRVRFGLWASVLLHAAHNSLFILLVLAGAH